MGNVLKTYMSCGFLLSADRFEILTNILDPLDKNNIKMIPKLGPNQDADIILLCTVFINNPQITIAFFLLFLQLSRFPIHI